MLQTRLVLGTLSPAGLLSVASRHPQSQGLRWLTCQVEAAYNRRVTNKELSLDNHQVKVVGSLADLGENLVSYENLLKEKSVKKASIFNRLFN